MDIICGNWGKNSKLKASPEQPLKMFVNDFDQNKKTEFLITWYGPEDDYPSLFPSKRDLTAQLPHLKKTILKNHQYADSKLEDLFDEEVLASSLAKEVNNLQTGVFLNTGEFQFKFIPLPDEAQLAPIFAVLPLDINKDGNMDLVIGGNLYALKPDIGRMDSSLGTVLIGDGEGGFKALSRLESGLYLKGEIRDLKSITTADGKELILAARNNNEIQVYEINM